MISDYDTLLRFLIDNGAGASLKDCLRRMINKIDTLEAKVAALDIEAPVPVAPASPPATDTTKKK